MAWYNPFSWFKNTPKQVETPTTNTGTGGTVSLTGGNLTGNVNTGVNLTGGNLTGNTNTGGSLTGNIFTGSPISVLDNNIASQLNTPTIQQLSNTGTYYWTTPDEGATVKNPYKETLRDKVKRVFSQHDEPLDMRGELPVRKRLEAEWDADEAKKNAKELSGFSLDPYQTTSTGTVSDPIKLNVTTAGEEQDKSFMENYADAKAAYIESRKAEGKGEDYITGPWIVMYNALEREYPTYGQWHVENAVSEKYGGDLKTAQNRYSDTDWLPEGWNMVYEGPNKEELRYDINNTIYQEYLDLASGKKTADEFYSTIDSLYNKYEGNFKFVGIPYKATEKPKMSKDLFLGFVENEWKKIGYREEITEAKGLPSADDQSAYVLTEALDKAYKEIGPKVQLSTIATVEGREEFMNDAKANMVDFVGRLYQRLHPTLRVKSELQRILGVDDLDELTIDEIPDQYKEIARQIWRTEEMFNKFVDNYIIYLGSLASYADPVTGKIDRMPDVITTPEGESHTYRGQIFDGIVLDEDDKFWRGAMGLDTAESPIDILQKRGMNISLERSTMNDGFIGQAWQYFQYGGSNVIGSTVSELGQQFIGRPLNFIGNVMSRESGEVPFEFVDMDSSLMASMTTNDSNRGRLMQSYSIKTQEYVPELAANIIEAFLVDKGSTKLGELGQARVLTKLNTIPYFRNTVKGQQAAQGIAYIVRGLQRLGTDQILIDAPLAIGDTEFGSETSKKFSIYGTIFGEGIGILSDLRALNRSILMNFMKTTKADEMVDPIRLMVNNEGILDDVAASMGRTAKDESGKIVGDQYKLLIQDLSTYSKFMNDLSDIVTKSVKDFLTEGGTVDVANNVIKQGAYNVFKQVYAQNSAMSKVITDLITDSRANIADIVKYIGGFDKTVKIGPFISTIKINDGGGNFLEKVVQKYNERMDMIIDGGLVAGINRGLTKGEVEELIRQGFIPKESLGDPNLLDFPEEYFVPHKYSYIENVDKNTSKIKEGTKYYLTEKGLQKLGVDIRSINDPLAIAIMSDDSKALIDKLKSLPDEKRRISDTDLDTIGEVDGIRRLAENIANIEHLDICK